jgi:hypothetical protein
MGLENMYSTFYRLFGGNEDMEENSYNSNLKYIPAESIFIDGNFIIYHIISNIEHDLNEILKIILTVKHTTDKKQLFIILDKLIEKTPLKEFKVHFNKIFLENNYQDMIKVLKELTMDINNKNNIIKDIICVYYLNYFIKKIINLHYTEFIKNLYIIFDGIPSGFKIIEQRRRRILNFLESKLRKKMLKNKMINFVRLNMIFFKKIKKSVFGKNNYKNLVYNL